MDLTERESGGLRDAHGGLQKYTRDDSGVSYVLF